VSMTHRQRPCKPERARQDLFDLHERPGPVSEGRCASPFRSCSCEGPGSSRLPGAHERPLPEHGHIVGIHDGASPVAMTASSRRESSEMTVFSTSRKACHPLFSTISRMDLPFSRRPSGPCRKRAGPKASPTPALPMSCARAVTDENNIHRVSGLGIGSRVKGKNNEDIIKIPLSPLYERGKSNGLIQLPQLVPEAGKDFRRSPGCGSACRGHRAQHAKLMAIRDRCRSQSRRRAACLRNDKPSPVPRPGCPSSQALSRAPPGGCSP